MTHVIFQCIKPFDGAIAVPAALTVAIEDNNSFATWLHVGNDRFFVHGTFQEVVARLSGEVDRGR